MATRIDPFGEYDHIKPVSLEEAAAALADAYKATWAASLLRFQKPVPENVFEARNLAEVALNEAHHRMTLSALVIAGVLNVNTCEATPCN